MNGLDMPETHPEFLYVAYKNKRAIYKVPYELIPLLKEIYEYSKDGVGGTETSPIILTLNETEITLQLILANTHLSFKTLNQACMLMVKNHLDYFKVDTTEFEKVVDHLLELDYHHKLANFFEQNLHIFDQLFKIIPFNKQKCIETLNDENSYANRRSHKFYKSKFDEAVAKHVPFHQQTWRSYLFGGFAGGGLIRNIPLDKEHTYKKNILSLQN